jgi:RNA polymerase sigma-70 factor (ECF subfamily)
MNRQAVADHLPGLRRYARALTGDPWAADDLVQDTLERACVKWRLWLAGTDLRAWLFTVMHNLFISQLRQDHRRAGLVQAMDVDELAQSIEAPASASGTAMDLQRCLLRLPAEQREVLLLVTLEDMSYAEVAKVVGVPPGTVMSRLSRARERMRSLMDAPASPAQVSMAPVSTAPVAVSPATPALRRLK